MQQLVKAGTVQLVVDGSAYLEIALSLILRNGGQMMMNEMRKKD